MTTTPPNLHPESMQRVAQVLRSLGHPHAPIMLSDAARTAQQAADALGITLGQIAESIIFKRKPDSAAVLVITSGDRRVDKSKVQPEIWAGPRRLGRQGFAQHAHILLAGLLCSSSSLFMHNSQRGRYVFNDRFN